jgi:hypothetical protein
VVTGKNWGGYYWRAKRKEDADDLFSIFKSKPPQ